MMYLKLSLRNARRSFTNYLLYVMTMTLLLAIMEASNCIAIMGKLSGFQTISFPLLISIILIGLIGHIDAFMLKQRAKEFASYLLLGMKKRELTNLFLCEILLIGFFCFLAGTTIGFVIYGFLCFDMTLYGIQFYGFLYGKSLVYTLCCFFLIEMICAFRLKQRLDRLQIRELMYEKNRNQRMESKNHCKTWGIIFFSSFICLIGIVCSIVFLPEDYIVYVISIVAIPLLLSIYAFYKWILGYLYAYRKRKDIHIYEKNKLYIMAKITSDFKTTAMTNTIFCICFLFSAMSFITGMLMLQPELQIFSKEKQQWMGTAQISICIVFTIIYFSILSLQQIIEIRQDSKNNQILFCLGKSSRQIKTLIKQQITIKMTLPMILALLLLLFCIPLLNRKMNLILPVTMQNALFKFAGDFLLCTLFFYLCYFFVVYTMSRQYIKSTI